MKKRERITQPRKGTIRKKLIIGFLAISAISLLIGLIGIISIDLTTKNTQTMYEQETATLADMTIMTKNFEQIRTRLEKSIRLTDPEVIQREIDYVTSTKDEIAMAALRFKRTLIHDEDKAEFDNILKALVDYNSDMEEVMSLALERKTRSAYEVLDGSAEIKAQKLNDLIDKVVQQHLKSAKKKAEMNSHQGKRANTLMLIVVLAGLILSIIYGWTLATTMTKPLQKGVHFARSLAEGDLTNQIDVRTKDELEELASALNLMVVQLREIIGNILSAAHQITISSEEQSKTAQNLAAGSQLQSASIEEAAASMKEMHDSVSTISEKTREQSENTHQATSAMGHLEASIRSIAGMSSHVKTEAANALQQAVEAESSSQLTITAIKKVEESSEKINGILEIISDIADQTNLLALNASIEAARAGESGRGFAVVAKEISKLADRSAAATQEIEHLITESGTNIQSSSRMVMKVDDIIKKMREIVSTTSDYGAKMSISAHEQLELSSQIGTAIHAVNKNSQQIADQTKTQAVQTAEMSRTINSINSVTQETAATAATMAASTEELSAQAESMKTLVSKFKIS